MFSMSKQKAFTENPQQVNIVRTIRSFTWTTMDFIYKMQSSMVTDGWIVATLSFRNRILYLSGFRPSQSTYKDVRNITHIGDIITSFTIKAYVQNSHKS